MNTEVVLKRCREVSLLALHYEQIHILCDINPSRALLEYRQHN